MLSQYIQSPYVVFSFGLAKPSLIIAISYVFVLAIILIIGTKIKNFKLQLCPRLKIRRGERNKVIFSLVGFVVMLVSCIIFPLFLADGAIIISISKVYLQYEALAFAVKLYNMRGMRLSK